jgi:hypothetical protein
MNPKYLPSILGALLIFTVGASRASGESTLIGHWPLRGDARDHSGHGNDAVNHGVDLAKGQFDGASAYLEVPNNPALQLGTSDFSFCAWIHTDEQLDDIVGDLFDKYDPKTRRGVTLTCNSSAGGYQSQGTDRHIHFGIDNATDVAWQDCGHPNPNSNYVNNCLTVFKGKLYAGTSDGKEESQWRHVYRYDGDGKWTDCGQVGEARTTGVGALIVHNGDLYAATSTYDWTRVKDGDYDPGRVYRYLGGQQWEDCGAPSDDRTLNSLASFQGKLYAAGGPNTKGVFVRERGNDWRPAKVFTDGSGLKEYCFPHAMCRHNGKLFVGWPAVFAFDGHGWSFAGDPIYHLQNGFLQTHSLELYQGKLHAGTWPEAKAAAYEGGEEWQDLGRVGEDGTETNALAVYNGKLYGGSIPRAEVCRYDGDASWTSLRRFYSPEGWRPGLPGKASRKEVNEWSRVTSLTVCDGKLFAGAGSCTSSVKDAPIDVRGKVFGMEAGKMASYDDDLGAGWKHLAAVRDGRQLKLYIDGKLAAKSTEFEPSQYDLSNAQPLRIGFGQTEYFAGAMNDVRLYQGALSEAQIQDLSSKRPD